MSLTKPKIFLSDPLPISDVERTLEIAETFPEVVFRVLMGACV